MLPHLGAAYRLARWLTGNGHDAEDVVQEAYLRAYKSFGSFRGGEGHSWLLAVVRNTCWTWLGRHRNRDVTGPLGNLEEVADDSMNPERLYLQKAAGEMVREALGEEPAAYREVLVLRELEGCSYKEIAAIASVPLGTVMSRLKPWLAGRVIPDEAAGPRRPRPAPRCSGPE
jgi:RNA polymerase sigma-70 factor (ECF subfamily)